MTIWRRARRSRQVIAQCRHRAVAHSPEESISGGAKASCRSQSFILRHKQDANTTSSLTSAKIPPLAAHGRAGRRAELGAATKDRPCRVDVELAARVPALLTWLTIIVLGQACRADQRVAALSWRIYALVLGRRACRYPWCLHTVKDRGGGSCWPVRPLAAGQWTRAVLRSAVARRPNGSLSDASITASIGDEAIAPAVPRSGGNRVIILDSVYPGPQLRVGPVAGVRRPGCRVPAVSEHHRSGRCRAGQGAGHRLRGRRQVDAIGPITVTPTVLLLHSPVSSGFAAELTQRRYLR